METSHFRQQHKEILEIVGVLGKACAQPAAINAAAGASIRSNLVALAGKVTVHLSAEDRGLYPALLAQTGTPAHKVAEAFAQEMGSLAGAFKQFVAHWPNGEAIAANPTQFASECGGIAEALGKRIQREEKDLYPLLDALA